MDLGASADSTLALLEAGFAQLAVLGGCVEVRSRRLHSVEVGRLWGQCRTCTALDVQDKGMMDLVDLGAVAQGVHSAGVGVFGPGHAQRRIYESRGEPGGEAGGSCSFHKRQGRWGTVSRWCKVLGDGAWNNSV